MSLHGAALYGGGCSGNSPNEPCSSTRRLAQGIAVRLIKSVSLALLINDCVYCVVVRWRSMHGSRSIRYVPTCIVFVHVQNTLVFSLERTHIIILQTTVFDHPLLQVSFKLVLKQHQHARTFTFYSSAVNSQCNCSF